MLTVDKVPRVGALGDGGIVSRVGQANPLVQHMQKPLNGGHARAPNEPFWFPATTTDHPPLVPNETARLRQERDAALAELAAIREFFQCQRPGTGDSDVNPLAWTALEMCQRLVTEHDAALIRIETAERLAGSTTTMKSQRIAALEAENTRLRERDASFHRAVKRITTAALLCLGLSVPAMAQQSQPYEPTVTVLARQAQLCEQVASREIARVTEENAALKKQIEDAKLKPAEPAKP